METVVYVTLGATILLAIAGLVQLRILVVAVASLNVRAALRAAGTMTFLVGMAVVVAVCSASAPTLFLPSFE